MNGIDMITIPNGEYCQALFLVLLYLKITLIFNSKIVHCSFADAGFAVNCYFNACLFQC